FPLRGDQRVTDKVGQHLTARVENVNEERFARVRGDAGQVRADARAFALHRVAAQATPGKNLTAMFPVTAQLDRGPEALHHAFPIRSSRVLEKSFGALPQFRM